MAIQETYPRAPIVEAVLDIRTRLSNPLSQESLTSIHDREREAYPNVRHPYTFQFKVEQREGNDKPVADTSYTETGRIFASEDGLQLFQCRQDGFSHNRLAPYTEWAVFKAEARRLWNSYQEAARPVHIEMLGLNFINRILVSGGEDMTEYFKVYVEVPKELNQSLDVHNFQIQTTDQTSGAKISISSSLGAIDADGKIPVLLNIQSFMFLNKPILEIEEQEIWKYFETLRDLKNLAFESSVTGKVRSTFR